jgi:hypothetical protein
MSLTARGGRRQDPGLEKGAAGDAGPPPPTHITRSPATGYRQQLEPQQLSRLAWATPVGHSPTQHAQVQFVHVQLPVSQQPQQSHVGQPVFWLTTVAGTKGRRPNAAQTIRLFMGKLHCIWKLDRSRHVTTCERGKATAGASPISGLTSTEGETRYGGRFSSARRQRGSAAGGPVRPTTQPDTRG